MTFDFEKSLILLFDSCLLIPELSRDEFQDYLDDFHGNLHRFMLASMYVSIEISLMFSVLP